MTSASVHFHACRRAMFYRTGVSLALLFGGLLCTGCGDASNQAKVHGKVTYQGEPLPNGTITFFPSQGRPKSVALSQQGAYSIELPPGDFTVIVGVGREVPAGLRDGA